jgi:hypothetical protein
MKIAKLLCGTLLLLLVCSPGWSQTLATSQISGDITDQTGASVPDAQIKLTQTDTGQVHTAKSSATGAYIIPDLPSGPYRLEVALTGFRSYVQTGIVLEVSTNPQINVQLSVGTVDQKVVVQANALMVETESNGVGQVIDQKQVVELPLNGRDPTQLIALAGATTAAPAGDLNTNKNFPSITIAVAGGLPNGVTYILDGGSHNDAFNNLNLPLPFPDALQEFKVETNSLPAQYGDHATAAVNVVTKSGGNQFHGDAFEFVRNYMFNAKNFFSVNRDSLKRNQFGGVLGGPIKRDKLFFFGGYEGTIVRSNPPDTYVQVPTAAMLAGDFSQVTAPISAGGCQKSQVTLHAPFATVDGKPNQINPALFSPQALAALKHIPVATAANDASPAAAGLPVGCGYVVAQVPASFNETMAIGRLDYDINTKHRLYARYFFGLYNQPVPPDPSNALNTNGVAQYNEDSSVTIGDTYTFTANLINAAHITGRRTVGHRTVDPYFDPASLGIDTYNSIPGFMALSVTGGINLGAATVNPGYFNTTALQFTDDLDFIHGSHQISVGMDYIYALMNTANNRPTNGIYTFTGSTLSSNGSYGYADFLTGFLDTFSQGNPDIEDDGQSYFALYAQDSWKTTRRLTVNYGLRWEPYMPEHNSNGHVENFSMANFAAGERSQVFVNAPAGMSFEGDPGYPGNHYTFGKADVIEPRIGVIFDPIGNGKMTIRAGYGIFYDAPQLFFNTRYSNSPPFGSTISLAGPLPFASPWATYPGGIPFPGLSELSPTVPFPTEGVYVNSPLHIQPMYLQQFNASVQRQIGSWLFSGTYLGNTTRHLPTSYEADPAIYDGKATLAKPNTNPRRLLALQNKAEGSYYSTIGQYDDGGMANYNGLLLSAQTRGKNFNLVANYTYAHCLSDAETTELTGPSYLIPPSYNPQGRSYSYSNCDSDRRHVANVSFVGYAPKFSDRYANLAFSGWELATIFTATSGLFGTVQSGNDNALSGETGELATYLSNPYTKRTRFGADNNLTAAAFGQPALGTYSLQTPLTISGPGSYELDMALSRNFKVPRTESQTVQLRWEVFNVPNEAIFVGAATGGTSSTTGPVQAGAVTSSTFGNFTAAANPRIMQFALKYIF